MLERRKNTHTHTHEREFTSHVCIVYIQFKISIFDDVACFTAHLMAIMCQNEKKNKKTKTEQNNNKQKQQKITIFRESQHNMLHLNMQNFCF